MEQTNTDVKGVIAICTPMSGGVATQDYVSSLLQVVERLKASGYVTSFYSMAAEGSKHFAKNLLIHDVLKNKDTLGILFIDSDHGVDDSDVLRMIESEKDVIGAIVPQQQLNWGNIKNASLTNRSDLHLYSGLFAVDFLEEDDTVVPYYEAFEVEMVGSGLMYVSKQALETLKDYCNSYLIYSSVEEQASEEIVEYFTLAADEETKELMSEDYNFCKKWRDAGGSVWAAAWVKNSRTGLQRYDGSFLHTLDLASEVKKLTELAGSED